MHRPLPRNELEALPVRIGEDRRLRVSGVRRFQSVQHASIDFARRLRPYADESTDTAPLISSPRFHT